MKLRFYTYLYHLLDAPLARIGGYLEELREDLYYRAHPVRAYLEPNPHPPGSLEAKMWDDARGIVRTIVLKESPWSKLLKPDSP